MELEEGREKMRMRLRRRAVGLACLAGILVLGRGIGHMVRATAGGAQAQTVLDGVPVFELDPSWPKPLPNHWMYGLHLGVAVDARDHVWFLHGPFGSDGSVLTEAAAVQKG